MTGRSPRRELMRPAQLLGLAFAAALFAFLVTIFAMGIAQDIPGRSKEQALLVGGILGGSVFVVTLVVIALLLLAVDPATVAKTVDRPVLLPKGEDGTQEPGGDGSTASGAAPEKPGR